VSQSQALGVGEPAGEVVEDEPAIGGRWGPLYATIWLFLLLDPLLEGWSRRDETEGFLGLACTVAFAVVYLSLWERARANRRRMAEVPPLPWALAYVGALVVLGALCIALLGEPGMACVVYVSVACVMALPLPVAAPVAALLVAGTLAVGALEDWGTQVGVAFGTMAGSLAVLGLRAVTRRNLGLTSAYDTSAALAVDNERNRFARDLHDIMGHSLTVISVKAELAQKLIDVDLDRARAEIVDLERLSRDALLDVRRAVEGYRDITLTGELVRAKAALNAAEIGAELPSSTDRVPPDLDELFAWTIREGVTNVIRHSRATRCEIVLTPTSAEIRDDGTARPSPQGQGSGLAGLQERADEVGAVVVTRLLSPGFSLQVVRA
jgi:two-component system sensor histidine kinase DesK